MEQQREMIVDKSGSMETIELVRWCLEHDLLRQAADDLLCNAAQMLTDMARPVLSMQGDAVLGKLERSAVLAAAQSLDASNLLTAPTELLTWKVGVIQKLMDNAKLREALYSAVLLNSECAMREQADDARLQEELSPVFGEEILSIVDGKEAELREACFLAVDLVRSMFKADGEHKSVWRSAAESRNWVQRHRPGWLCPEASEVSAFESRTPAWMRDGGEREALMRALPSTADPLLLLADEDLAGVLLFPILTAGENAEAGSLLSMFTDTEVFQLNGRVSVPRFVRVLLDLHFIERLRGTLSPTVNTPKSDEAFVEAENKVWRALYTEDKRRGERNWGGVPDFQADEYKVIVDRAMTRLRDLLAQAAYTDEQAKSTLDMHTALDLSLVDTVDERVDEYSESKPCIKELLIVSLSTFPNANTIQKSEYTYTRHDGTKEMGEYYYQQEPFPRILCNQLQENSEILMLVSPETQKKVSKTFGDTNLVESPQSYFMKAVRKELGDVIFKSVALDMDNPSSAVSEVVSHLREIKCNNVDQSLRIHLGTNGGLRSNQLILEAVLSLLKSDGNNIRIKPEDVWSLKTIDRNKYEVFNSSAEFRIFDFVSGINEFLQYGRVSLLDRFWEDSGNDASLSLDDSGKQLMDHIKTIANGIQFNDIATLEKGIRELRAFFFWHPSGTDASVNPYVQMFINEIREDYGALIQADSEADLEAAPSPLEEIKWCADKGFYMQAYTIAETRMPLDFYRKGIVKFGDGCISIADMVKQFESQKAELFLFNIGAAKRLKQQEEDDGCGVQLDDDPKKLYNIRAKNGGFWFFVSSKINNQNYKPKFQIEVPQAFDDLILSHFTIKNMRNPMCHPNEAGVYTAKAYQDEIDNYIKKVSELYDKWGKQKIKGSIQIELLDDDGLGAIVWDVQSHEPFALATPATQPAIMVDQSHDAEVIREFTAEDLSFDGAVSEQAVKRIKNNLINKRLPQWTDALACIEKAKTPEDVNKQISAAMPVLKATALRKLAQLDSIEQNGKQLREGSREKAYIVKWGKVREYVGDAGKEDRDKLASWLINALDDGKTAAAICSLFDDDKAQ